ncbi:MAG: DUF2806 domain-containing protein [Candidatus Poribacteria bacterium]|nr:DUF2806 domain-containing protein [Candidatus Poribacteria bacterium]MDE0503891.1 DUF2806 domain-containing protein [Candidatus Poribacteria bacterium]
MDVSIPALEKLVDYVASGVGSVAGPMLAPWKARQETKARLVNAKGRADELVIQARGQSTALQLIADAQEKAREFEIQGQMSFNETVNQTIQFQAEKRQRNIKAVVNQAATELGDKNVPNSEPDHDWTARFFNEVQDVSSEGMQTLWARILAGKVERPESTSIKTLGILRNLDQHIATLFSRLCSLCVSIENEDARVPSLGGDVGNNSLEKYGLGFGKLNELSEHGLIISNYTTWHDYINCIGRILPLNVPHRFRIPFNHQGRFWVLAPISGDTTVNNFKLFGVALTQSGAELLKVVDIDPVDNYTQDLIRFFNQEGLQMTESDSTEPQILPM